jgi:hypothetical protein
MNVFTCVTLLVLLCKPLNINYNPSLPNIDTYQPVLNIDDSDIICIKEKQIHDSHIRFAKSRIEYVEVTYKGTIIPPDKYEYHTVRGGKKYSGELILESCLWKGGKTIATYSGSLSEE